MRSPHLASCQRVPLVLVFQSSGSLAAEAVEAMLFMACNLRSGGACVPLSKVYDPDSPARRDKFLNAMQTHVGPLEGAPAASARAPGATPDAAAGLLTPMRGLGLGATGSAGDSEGGAAPRRSARSRS